jgi:hypothetical protein
MGLSKELMTQNTSSLSSQWRCAEMANTGAHPEDESLESGTRVAVHGGAGATFAFSGVLSEVNASL